MTPRDAYIPHPHATFCAKCGRSHDTARCPLTFDPEREAAHRARGPLRGGRAGNLALHSNRRVRREVGKP